MALQYKVLLSLGSNLGNREHYIQQAFFELENHPSIRVLKKSTLLETEPLEVINQPKFINAVMKIQTALSPMDLLITIKSMEEKIGRIQRYAKGPREIDIDILMYEDLSCSCADLIIPHPSIYNRPFIKTLLISIGEEQNIFQAGV